MFKLHLRKKKRGYLIMTMEHMRKSKEREIKRRKETFKFRIRVVAALIMFYTLVYLLAV